MEVISATDLDFGLHRPRFGSSSGRDLVLIFRRNLPGPVLAFNRWEMARSLISSGTVNLQFTSISDAAPKAEISDEILTVATRNSTLFFTGTGASPMPKARAASLPEAVCTNLKADNVRSPAPPIIFTTRNVRDLTRDQRRKQSVPHFRNASSSRDSEPRSWRRHTHSSAQVASPCHRCSQ